MALATTKGNFSIAMTPLMWEGNAIGMLNVSRVPGVKFNEKELSLLRTFADQAVIAIQNARLFEEVQARTRDLQESLEYQTATSDVLKVISRSSFDLQPVLDTLVDTAVKLCGALNGTICLREGDGYRYRASSGIHGDWARFLDEHPPTPGRDSMTGRVLLSGRPESVPDVLEDPDYIVPLAAMNKTRSVFGVPLLRHDRVEGVLLLARAEPGLFTQRQIELVQTFADQAVIAIENARLLTELRQRTDDLTESLEHLRTAQDRLVQTEKLASLGQLTAGIAHEIKNPLNFVNNFSALSAELIDELGETLASAPLDRKMRGDVDELTQMLKSNLEKVVQHGKRADSIVKNMLLHSREGSGEQRSADINALLDESLNLAYHGARAEKPEFNITLRRDLDPDAGTINVFPQEIARAFINLISNGFYAASKRKAGNGEADFEPVLSAATKNLGNHIEIRIRDNGTGIPPEVKDEIFNPFFTTKPAGEGTGLGLSMSHDIIVKQHGGSIDVETEPGLFTEFKILLPRTGQR
jgi:signal transduction histidine kinase